MRKLNRRFRAVCEGPCNPDVQSVDAMISDHTRRSLDRGVVAFPVEILDRAARLRHTPHTEITIDAIVCDICGTARQWGQTA